MGVPLLDLHAQWRQIADEVKAALEPVYDSQYFIMGPQVATLETEIAEYCGAVHGVGCASGSDALVLALMALEVGPGDEVILTLREQPGIEICAIHGDGGQLPLDPQQNAVGVVIGEYLRFIDAEKQGVRVELFKNMPLKSGMGSSAASSAVTATPTSAPDRATRHATSARPPACWIASPIAA